MHNARRLFMWQQKMFPKMSGENMLLFRATGDCFGPMHELLSYAG